VSLLEGRPVRNFLELQDLSQVRPLRDHLNGLAVVDLEELPQGQQSEVLSLDKVLSAELGRVGIQRLLPDGECQPGKLQRALGHGGHGSNPLSMTYRSAFS